jgi:uncharacterized protein (TIGR00645 family)
MSSHSHSPEPGPDSDAEKGSPSVIERVVEGSIFSSRWLQAPLYLGLIVAQMVYVCQFFAELWHLLHVFVSGGKIEEVSNHIMIGILGLIDVVMVATLLVKATFVIPVAIKSASVSVVKPVVLPA